MPRSLLLAGALASCAAAPRSNLLACDAQVCSGLLRPPETGAGIRDVAAGSGAAGHHFSCRPAEAARWNGRTLVHVVGTGGDPASRVPFLLRACALGFAGVAPMYEDAVAARQFCGNDPACYEPMRREVVFGQDLAPDPIHVDGPNSLVSRVETLLAYLASHDAGSAGWARIHDRFAARDFSSFAFSGHSQGSGHVLLIAHDFAVERAIMFGGVPDRVRAPNGASRPVDWIAGWPASNPRTDAGRLFAFNHQDDPIAPDAEVMANFDLLGVPPASCSVDGVAAPSAGCHRLRIPSAGCGGVVAHLLTQAPTFGTVANPCELGGSRSSNLAAWDFLLTSP